jgi:hypothetical protein
LDICVLSLEEAGRLEHWGRWPTCKAHRHISRSAAAEGLSAGLLRFVGGPDTKITSPVSMVVEIRVREWVPVKTSMEDGTPIMGLRTWGLQRS